MDAIVAAFAEQHTELERLIEPLDPQGWARPAPDCAGWSLTDVVLHLAQADEWAMAGPTEGNTAAATRMATGPDGQAVLALVRTWA